MSQKIILLSIVCWIGTFYVSKGFLFGWEVRFNGGNSDMAGRLEVRYGDLWGYVCADGFGQIEGDVICKIVGNSGSRPYKFIALKVYTVSPSRLDVAPVILEGVKCNGSEDRIFECQHNGLFNASCPTSAVVGVECGPPQETTDINTEVEPRPFLGVYFCDFPFVKKLVYCDDGTQTETTGRFLSENNLYYSVRRRYCPRDNGRGTCSTYPECSEKNNDSVICLQDYIYRRPSTAAAGPRRMRLVGGNSSREGRIEVSLGGQQWSGPIWGGVCSRFWGPGSARLVCHRLGFSGVEDYGTIEGNTILPVLQYLSCNDAHEQYWYQCLFRYTWPEKITCASYASVKCSDFANEGTLRLKGSVDAVEGRLEIFHDGAWGSVRHRYFTHVVCNQLGYPGNNYSTTFIQYDLYDVPPVVLDVITCDGSELSLLDCKHRWYDDSHTDIYRGGFDVRCNRPGKFTPRLYNGTSVYEGRLELWEGDQWRRVCSSTIGRQEADVICKQLGHKSVETFYNWPKFGNGINPVLSWSFSCDHSASSITECDVSYLATRNLNCDSVAVKCSILLESATNASHGMTGSKVMALFGVAFVLLGFSFDRVWCVSG